MLIAFLTSPLPFFWDTVQLGAMQGDWFFRTADHSLLLPDRIDSGHIPGFGLYLSTVWHWFGQSLVASHLAMAPWLWLLFYQLVRLGRYSAASSYWWLLPLIALADPVLLGQMVLISPDIVLVAAFLLSVNSILEGERNWLAVGIAILGLISLRGMMIGLCLFFWDAWLHWSPSRREAIKKIGELLLPYLPGGLLAIAYLSYHYWAKGWVGIHEDSPWAESFALSSFGSLLRQGAVVIWRLLDFGRVFVWLVLLITLATYGLLQYKNAERQTFYDWQQGIIRWFRAAPGLYRKVGGLCMLLLIVIGLPALLSQGLSQHRYFLPFFLCLSWFTLLSLDRIPRIRRRKWLAAILILGLFSGIRWIYPDHIAQGWDASPAHLPYYNGRAQAIAYLDQKGIPLSAVGTAFPEVGPVHFRELNDRQEGMIHRDLSKQSFIYYSNVMNDFTDEELQLLQTAWDPVFSYDRWGVKVMIYQGPSSSPEQQ